MPLSCQHSPFLLVPAATGALFTRLPDQPVQSSRLGISPISPRASSFCMPSSILDLISGRLKCSTSASRMTRLSFSSSAIIAARALTFSLRSSEIRALTSLPRRFLGIGGWSARWVQRASWPRVWQSLGLCNSPSSINLCLDVDRSGEVCHISPHRSGFLLPLAEIFTDHPLRATHYPMIAVAASASRLQLAVYCQPPRPDRASLNGRCGGHAAHTVATCGNYALVVFPIAGVRFSPTHLFHVPEHSTQAGLSPTRLCPGLQCGSKTHFSISHCIRHVELHSGVNAGFAKSSPNQHHIMSIRPRRKKAKSFAAVANKLTVWKTRITGTPMILRLIRIGYADSTLHRFALLADEAPVGQPSADVFDGEESDQLKGEMIAIGERLAGRTIRLYQHEYAPLATVGRRRR